MRTIVICPTRKAGMKYCAANGIRPGAKDVRMIGWRHSARGVYIGHGDFIHVVPGDYTQDQLDALLPCFHGLPIPKALAGYFPQSS